MPGVDVFKSPPSEYTLRKRGSLAVPQVEPLKILQMVLNESIEPFLEPFGSNFLLYTEPF